MNPPIDYEAKLDALETPIPWWQSRGIIGALVTVAASLLGIIGYTVNVSAATDLALSLITLVAGAVSWWGRVRAQNPISTRQVLPGLTLSGEDK